MKRYRVEVLGDCEGKSVYIVSADSPDDALQIAFALDGGWGKDKDAGLMLNLAKSYCRVLHKQQCDHGVSFGKPCFKCLPMRPEPRKARFA